MQKIECSKGHITTYEILALPSGDLRYWRCNVKVFKDGGVKICGCGIKIQSKPEVNK